MVKCSFDTTCDEKGRYETTKEQLRETSLVGIMLSNCSALEIIDNQYRMITSEPQGHNIEKLLELKHIGIKMNIKKKIYLFQVSSKV